MQDVKIDISNFVDYQINQQYPRGMKKESACNANNRRRLSNSDERHALLRNDNICAILYLIRQEACH